MGTAVFFANTGTAVGGGHLSRCIAIAAMLAQRGWKTAFAVTTDQAAAVVEANGHAAQHVSPQDERTAMLRAWPDGVDILVVDHYERDASFESSLRGWAR